MQKNIQQNSQSQQHKQFLAELGTLLTVQTRQGQSSEQRQAVAHLAEYVCSARRHHKLTRKKLAQKTGKAEIEIYALEHGLVAYTDLDLYFLSRLAAALGEEVETLLLLLGQPALLQSAHTGNWTTANITTRSKQVDNWLLASVRANPLYKGSLNLIDFRQAGRLFLNKFFLPSAGYQVNTMIAVLVCLLLIWVSTYSLSGFFDAQSAVQAYATLPSSADVRDKDRQKDGQDRIQAVATQPVVASLELPPVSSKKLGIIAISPATVATDPEDDAHLVAVSLPALPASPEWQQCDSRTVGKFALCRM